MADQDKHSQDQSSQNEQDPKMDRLEEELEKMEIDEMMLGFTQEELEEKGILGDKQIEIKRKRFSETTEKEKLTIRPGIEYKRLPDNARFAALTIESLLLVKDVEPATCIATRGPNETVPFHAGNNVHKEENEAGEIYTAEVKGKVVIIKDTMHVFSSDIDCTLDLCVNGNKMKVYMDCTPEHGNGEELTLNLVLGRLAREKVVHGINKDVIEKNIAEAKTQGIPLKDVIVAEGTPPIPGDNATVEYNFDMSGEKHSFTIQADGKVDYKGSANILTAKKDQLLATIRDAQRGIDGVNVLGETVASDVGKNTKLIAGRGVRADEEGKQFFAESSGYIVLNFPLIEVLELYEVSGDVDYSTGSIDFKGNVLVHGNVREGFEVKAEGDVIIMKCVESAKVEAGRDVRIAGGIIGQGKGLVSAGRDVYAEYVQNGRIEAQANVYLNDFSVNSYVFCNYLNMQQKHGSVVGGEVYAQRGIDVLNIGSASGTKTYVHIGIDFLVKRKIGEIDKTIEFYEGMQKKIDGVLKPILAKLSKPEEAAKVNKSVIKKTMGKRKQIVDSLKVMQSKKSQLESQLEVEGICFTKVKAICFSDVFITIKNLKVTNIKKRQNIRFYEDEQAGEIKTGAY